MARKPIVEQRGLAFAPTIQDSFERFLEDNPWFLDEVTNRALALLDVGVFHFSMDAIFHSIRYDRAIYTKGTEGFKINNNWSSRATRLVEEREPRLANMFRKRGLKAA